MGKKDQTVNLTLCYNMTMITRHTYGKVTWLDIDKPTREDTNALLSEFNLHPILCNDLLSPSLRQKVDKYDDCIYLVLHFPVPHHDREHTIHEIDFVIGQDYIITVRYDALDPLHHFSKAFEVNSILGETDEKNHAGYFLYYMLKKLYDSTSIALSLIGERLSIVEDGIFSGNEYRMVKDLSVIQRDVLLYHRSLRNHKSILHTFQENAIKFFGDEYAHWTGALIGEYLKVEEKLDDRKEMVNALRTTNDSLLAAKTNMTMRSLTLTSVPIFLATLAATLFIAETKGSPIHESKFAFFMLVGITLGTLIISYIILFYRHRFTGWDK